MKNLTGEEKKFFEMIKSRGTKKISLNLGAETLDKIDELAGIFKISRTLLIESVMAVGLKGYIQIIERTNRALMASGEYKQSKELDAMFNEINDFKTKWKIK